MPKSENKVKGRLGETAAVKYLESEGYEILEINYRCKLGEIDIVAKENEYIIFVEVKSRQSCNFGYPCEAVSIRKQKKIISVAKNYILYKRIDNASFRFDVIEVYLNNEDTTINHISNAFWCS